MRNRPLSSAGAVILSLLLILPAAAAGQSVADIHALAALENPKQGDVATVAGFYAANDGGGGQFRYDSDDADAHDGGLIIAPGAPDPAANLAEYLNFRPGGPGRWVRISRPGWVSVRWFGARGDGEQDDSPAILRACAQFQGRETRGTVHIPQGTYYVADHVRLYPNVDITGDGIGNTIIERRNEDNYLLRMSSGEINATISKITFDNRLRVLLGRGVSRITFHDAEFLNGMVRFESSQHIRIDSCVFRDNAGKAAYASADCSYVTITDNIIRNTEYGGLNLSGHDHCIVANNLIVKDAIVADVPGYGGIRLPNSAHHNTVSGNIVRNFPRGIFVLTRSTYNTIIGNVVDGAAAQGMLIESDRNTISQNIVSNPGAECIRLSGTVGNVISGNQLSTTQPSQAALSVTSGSHNQLLSNIIDAASPLNITGTDAATNITSGNVVVAPPPPTTQPAEAETES